MTNELPYILDFYDKEVSKKIRIFSNGILQKILELRNLQNAFRFQT